MPPKKPLPPSSDTPDLPFSCVLCSRSFTKSAGLTNHLRKCQEINAERLNDAVFVSQLREERPGPATLQTPIIEEQATTGFDTPPLLAGQRLTDRGRPPLQHFHNVDEPETNSWANLPPEPIEGIATANSSRSRSASLSDSSSDASSDNSDGHCDANVGASPPRKDDIRIRYHPSSNRPTEIHHFEDYEQKVPFVPFVSSEEPWRPFRTRRDFEFATVAVEGSLSASTVDQLLDLTRGVSGDHRGELTLKSYKEMMEIWKLASHKLPAFESEKITKEYKGNTLEFTVWFRSIWDWILKVVQDPRLAPHFQWDAKKLYKFNGASWERFYHDPLTGNLCWEFQSSLPGDGKPIVIILYADKTRLSTFGTEKGYPVIARIGNLPVHIRNGEGFGGGVLVGWLPVIYEDPVETGTPKWVTLKAMVYHEAMRIILRSLVHPSHFGAVVTCGDLVRRCLYPGIPIKSADFEEVSIMSLTRGTKALFPCPVCLVPHDHQADHTCKFPRRYQDAMRGIYEEALAMSTLKAGNQLLKEHGLRRVSNAFWDINNSDPYLSVSFDCLHTLDSGLFGYHFFKQIIAHIDALGRKPSKKLDTQIDSIPRWRNLNHFFAISNIEFNDGSKMEDISKLIIFASLNILTKEADPAGYALLKCMRSYINIRMYAGLEVHTTTTLYAGENEVDKYSSNLKAYQELVGDDDELTKDWNFPKNHLITHLFDDIRLKGVTRNYNTKVNEKAHGPHKITYRIRTNFKNVAPQILNIDHIRHLAAFMKDDLAMFDYVFRGIRPPQLQDHLEDNNSLDDPPSSHYLIRLKMRKQVNLADYIELNKQDKAFQHFPRKLQHFFGTYPPSTGPIDPRIFKSPHNRDIKILSATRVDVNYESCVDWRQETDFIRCNPSFHGSPRYDHIIIQTANAITVPSQAPTLQNHTVAQLLAIITIFFNGTSYDVALILPYTLVEAGCDYDADLELLRLRASSRKDTELIFLDSIVRGALVCPDFDTEGEFFLVDTLDADMFLRARR